MLQRFLIPLLVLICTCPVLAAVRAEVQRPVIPVLKNRDFSPAFRVALSADAPYRLESVGIEITEGLAEVSEIALFQCARNGIITAKKIVSASVDGPRQTFRLDIDVSATRFLFWVAVTLKEDADIDHCLSMKVSSLQTSVGSIDVEDLTSPVQRLGVALRNPLQDGVYCYRIPGLVTTSSGTLIAIYDARHDSTRDLQGDIDVAVQTSSDGGFTWSPMSYAMDMGNYGGLPQKYNGVGDAQILFDAETNTTYVFAAWMFGVRDPVTNEWVEGLTDDSTIYNHRTNSSMSGFDIKRTVQFMMVKSTDEGRTWSQPFNLTRQVKKELDKFICPCPGRGIQMKDGTLVVPVQCRDSSRIFYATVTYSRDHGEHWQTANPSGTGGGESAVIERNDGSLMLNQHRRDNYRKTEGNGRSVWTSQDMGQTWQEHPTSRSALIEPPCEASLHKHFYHDKEGRKRSVLLFFNPNSLRSRNHMTLQVSYDDGDTWTKKIMLDEMNGSGYSCMTSIDENHVGILYEGSGADLQFQRIPLTDILQ